MGPRCRPDRARPGCRGRGRLRGRDGGHPTGRGLGPGAGSRGGVGGCWSGCVAGVAGVHPLQAGVQRGGDGAQPLVPRLQLLVGRTASSLVHSWLTST